MTEFLQFVLDHRRQSNLANLERLQKEIDQLHTALEKQWTSEQERLHGMKMAALAELAAGASHEINNPLAVISGQAQYALRHLQELDLAAEEDGNGDGETPNPLLLPLRHALQAIVGQTQRIHQLLQGLMQFARPASPQRHAVEVSKLVDEVVVSLQELANQRRVQLQSQPISPDYRLYVDPDQLRMVLSSILQNAIEAAPPEGWAGIRLQTNGHGRVDLIVEDNGKGPTPAAREHLFDPFFSGRSAGRGRGLGLSTAWRLARQLGGDVRFDDTSLDRTRFVLSLPLGVTDSPRPSSGENGLDSKICCK